MSSSSVQSDNGPPPGRMMGEVRVVRIAAAVQKPPQKKIDEFWKRFTTTAPGKATTILPKNELAERLAKRSAAKDLAGGSTKRTTTSYEEAAALCRAKVDQIVAECRRINQKYRDPHFDLDFDLRSGQRDCLESLSNDRCDYGSDSDDSASESSGSGPRLRPRPRPPPHRHGRPKGPDRRRDVLENGELLAVDRNKTRRLWPGHKLRPKSVKRVDEIFDDAKFYIDGPTANDVRQGRDGDCWLMAALCTLSNKPGLIERVCVASNQDVGVYGFVFHRDGEWYSEIIDDKLYLLKPDYDQARLDRSINLERILWEDMDRPDSEEIYRRTYQSNSAALYFAQCENPNETWLPLLEKAYAKAHGDYAAIEGGFTGEGIEDLTGGVTTEVFTTDILDKEYFWKEELIKVNKDFLFGCSTGLWGLGFGERKGIQELHAYSIMRAVEIDGQRLLLLKNPWGKGEWTGPWSDGSKEWTPEWLQKLDHRFGDDGAFWISYRDLLRKYQTFDRTRLFGPEWKITSMWTTLNISWSLEYHDTKFCFTLAKPGPVVIVLSQLDNRYFRGLEGPYQFGLGFRVHRAGEEDYLVRTQTTYRMTRSCNVELGLEAGEYTVLLKIDATRDEDVLPPEDVVRRNARQRREKLLRIGLAYDLAHSKARTVETAGERAAREAYEKRARERHRERLRKLAMEDKRRHHYRKCREVRLRRKEVAWQKEAGKRRAEKREARRTAAKEEPAKGERTVIELDIVQGEPAEEEPAREEEAAEAKLEQADSIEAKPTCQEEKPLAEGERPWSAPGDEHKSADNKQDKEPENQPESESSEAQVDRSSAEAKDDGKQAKSEAREKEGSRDIAEDTPSVSTLDTPTLELGDSERQLGAESVGENDKEAVSAEARTGPADGGASDATIKQTGASKEAGHESKPEARRNGAQAPAEPASNSNADSAAGPPVVGADFKAKLGNAVTHFKKALDELLCENESGSGSGDDDDDDDDEDGHPPPPHPRHPPHHARRPRPHVRLGFHGPPGPPSSAPPGRFPAQPSGFDSDSDDDPELQSVRSLSDISETELDFIVKDNELRAPSPSPGPMGAGPRLGGPPQPMDEFESDPWNAVAVVGLRIYYKVAEADKDAEGLVRLRVVRPNRYELSEDEESDDEGRNKGGGEGVDEEKEGGTDETKVLDLDDSAKDATVAVKGEM